MSERLTTAAFAALAAFWLWLALAAAPPGPFTVDDFFYIVSARRIWQGAWPVFDNGFADLGAEELKLWFLVEGPRGLTPQYPLGFALLAAPFDALLGLRGFFVVNALGALAMVWGCWRLALGTLGDRRWAFAAAATLALASHLVEYATGLWPHGASAGAAAVSAALFFEAEAREGRARARGAALAGLIGAVGLSMRLDVGLLAPTLLLWAVLCARAPLALLAWGGVGAAPVLALSSWANFQRFGTLNPVSYGVGREGGVDPAAHMGPALAVLSALGAAALWRALRARGAAPGKAMAAALGVLAAAGLGAALAAPHALWAALARAAQGAHAILIDIGAYSRADEEARIMRDAAGYLTFVGHYKKALLQGAPWIGLCAAALPSLAAPGAERRGVALCLLALATWAAPFVWLEWHGGLASNMRYLTPALAFAAVAAAVGARRLARIAGRPEPRALRLTAAAVLGATAASMAFGLASGAAAAPYAMLSLSRQAGLAAAAFGAAALAPLGASARRVAARAALGAAAVGVVAGAVTAHLYDLRMSFARREAAVQLAALHSDLPDDALLLTFHPQSFADRFLRHGQLYNLRRTTRDALDLDRRPIDRAFDEGRRVFADELFWTYVLSLQPGLRARPTGPETQPGFGMVEVFRDAPAKDGARAAEGR
ncbi:hypothetical protein [Oceanicella actignis]|uniref:4-amino-4-deoxy-L-arabinose transferase n=1 Tax=Oceanicella actignis TaxID=1189325 RepID=A0A1M7U0D3_9RHOB|nr:hypothetical protein [Oceanicella actignis]SET84198.1 hypothetical protein SAMN04488119_11158 [Oceanicella actignis]SHN76415.1 hypothetical protein SAMN05216200_11257 [Oceanicella actignis]